jgi:hypothetical protein
VAAHPSMRRGRCSSLAEMMYIVVQDGAPAG